VVYERLHSLTDYDIEKAAILEHVSDLDRGYEGSTSQQFGPEAE